jgi:four helix bundle protein
MPRLQAEFLERVESCCDRVLALVSILEKDHRPGWLTEQLARAATSVGANCYEADQAMSRNDFCKCLGISVKEISETRFWVRLIGRNEWIAQARLESLEAECLELQRIMNSIIINTRKRA